LSYKSETKYKVDAIFNDVYIFETNVEAPNEKEAENIAFNEFWNSLDRLRPFKSTITDTIKYRKVA
jgi:hypothetical protein